jgi:hypothetical protein
MDKQSLWQAQQPGSPSNGNLSKQDPSSQSANMRPLQQFRRPLSQSLSYGGQPYTPPQWEQPPRAQSVPRRSRGRLWFILSIIAIILFAGVGAGVFASQALSHNWTTIQTFKGNGKQRTPAFAVPNGWKIVGTCQGFTDGSGINRSLVVAVYRSNGTIANLSAIDTTCKAGSKPTIVSTEEHYSGSIYLDVSATGAWTIQVQEMK